MSRHTRAPDLAEARDGPLADLWAQFRRTRDRRIRERLILHYAPLVKFVAARVAVRVPATVDPADLVSNGMFGLIDAVDKYRPESDASFETYAAIRIRGAILDGLRQVDWVPRSVREKAAAVERTYRELHERLGRPPSDEEVAGHLGISKRELRRTFQQVSYVQVAALDELRPTGGQPSDGLSLGDTLPDTALPDPVAAYEAEELRGDLTAALRALPDRERLVISLYYTEGMTLAEIGGILGVSESRVSRLHTKAVLQLRARLGEDR